jgi:hypothetical protein
MAFASIALIIGLAASVLCIHELPVVAAGMARELFASSLGFAVLIAVFGKRSWFVRNERRGEARNADSQTQRRSPSCSGRFSWS